MTEIKCEGDAVCGGIKCPTPGCDGTISFVGYADRYYSGNVLVEECMFYCIRCDDTYTVHIRSALPSRIQCNRVRRQ